MQIYYIYFKNIFKNHKMINNYLKKAGCTVNCIEAISAVTSYQLPYLPYYDVEILIILTRK